MEINERLKNKIAAIFREVNYGTITFYLSPEKKTLDCEVKKTHKIAISKTDIDYDRIYPKNTS